MPKTPYYALTSGNEEYLSACEKVLNNALFITYINKNQGIIYVEGFTQLEFARQVLIEHGLYQRSA